MGVVYTSNKYYGVLDTKDFNNREMQLLTCKKIEYVIKHKQLGYCVRLYEQELESIKKTMAVKLTVWPDNDSYNYVDEFKLSNIYKETNTIEQVSIEEV